ncbi:MAG: hypothetical protein WCT04_21095 [Planctomycetota bacterium]
MTRFLLATLAGTIVLAGLMVLVIEWVCWTKGEGWRYPLYWGGAAGFLVNVLAYPFILKMAVLKPEDVKAGQSWTWWMLSVLTRMTGLGIMASQMSGRFNDYRSGVTLIAVLIYMAGMLAELAWIGRRFNAMDDK